MNTYCFPSNRDWQLFVDDPTQWKAVEDDGSITIPEPIDIICVLDDVKVLFEPHFGKDRVNSHHLSILASHDCPSTFSKRGIIFLSARGRYWAKYMYQFAHELCHFIIYDGVATEMRWFEETICELASLYFLDRLSEKWTTAPPYPSWRDYSSSIKSYSESEMATAEKIPNGMTFSDFIASSLPALEIDCYQRAINTLCANHLLPIFKAEPSLWKDVPKIGDLSPGGTFQKSLMEWKSLSENNSAVQTVIDVFFP